MNDLQLNRYNSPRFGEFGDTISALRNFLKEDVEVENPQWINNLETILDFQEESGSFRLLTDSKAPSDARVDFCYVPTYICSAILMKAYLTGGSILATKIENALKKALGASTQRNLRGHGYDGLRGQIEALNIFAEAGLREFIDLHSDLNPKFSHLILRIKKEFFLLEKEGRFMGPWGENYERDIRRINKYFKTRKVFVYGTLMKGEANHRLLKNSKFLNGATVEGYDMYNVGYYPAIIPGGGRALGELYEIQKRTLRSLDTLEGEGSLYIRKCEIVKGPNSKSLAYIYEFAQDTEGLEKINSWKDYVWYVSYGSNMLKERFFTYIEGGAFEDGGSYNEPCEDTSLPIEVRTLEIPYDMYFGNYSGSWNGCGVSFLDTTKKGKALGVAYLITRKQFEHVAAEENCGRFPDGLGFWYENIKSLGQLDGHELVTITNDDLRPYNEPCEEYLRTLKRGIRQNWPDMSEEEIDSYLDSCIR